MKVLYLYAEVMGYTLATIKALIDRGVEVHLIYWDNKKITPYKMPDYDGIRIYPRSKQSIESIIDIVKAINPDITVISGWQDKLYLSAARFLRSKNYTVVSGFDDQWLGTFRQYFAFILGMTGFFARYFSHAWVSGVFQYEYARKIGFSKKNIIFDLLSADLNLFKLSYTSSYEYKSTSYPHRFLYVGRFELVKGLDVLLAAWERLSEKRGDWELHLIGAGNLSLYKKLPPGVTVKNFMQPDELVNEVADSGCFILPSRSEPWGVVVHEFAAAGLPLILSDVVGASRTFLVPGMNGYLFESNSVESLKVALIKIIDTPDEMLLNMSEKSFQLANRISPETSAMNLISLINDNVNIQNS
jgi:glycosyltransferase involved in cell wall biosynthesis